MEHWPGHERQERTQTTEKPKDKGKQKGHRLRATLVSKDGRVRWSSVVDASRDTRWLPLGRPAKVFPETHSPQVDIHEYPARQHAEKGLQYLRTYFPDVEFPSELLGSMLEADARKMRRLKTFDPFLGNLLEIIPSHHTQNDSTVVFPMGELGSELSEDDHILHVGYSVLPDISHFSSDRLGNMVFNPAGSPSFTFETPILQISSAAGPSEWIATPSSTLLIRTHTSSSLLHVEHSKVTRELDITRSETRGIPIVDSRILASGPDIVVVDRSGKVYKCTTYPGGRTMQLIAAHEVSNDDQFWQLGITRRNDECFLASCKAVKHIDLRVRVQSIGGESLIATSQSASPVADVFSLDHPSAIVTSFESPMHDYISRITTTSDVIWLDDRFRRRPLLSFKHYRSFDRTLRVLTANLSGATFSLLTSRRNGFVTLYDISRGSDGLLHSSSVPSCLPHDGPMFTAYDGHALVTLPSDVQLAFLRLCQHGSIHRQDIRIARPDKDQPGSVQERHVTHQWDEDVQDTGEAGLVSGRLTSAQQEEDIIPKSVFMINAELFAADNTQEDMERNAFEDILAQLPDVWQDTEETVENMLTTWDTYFLPYPNVDTISFERFDVISGIEDGNKHVTHANFFAGSNINSKQVLDAWMGGHVAIQKLAGLARWHYNIQDTSVPGLDHHSVDCSALHEHLKELDIVSGVERHDHSLQRETEAREQLVLDLALSNDVYSARPLHSFTAGGATSNTMTRPTEISYSEEPPEVKFGYFRPVRKSGADHYADKDRDADQDPAGVTSPLGVRLLLAEWELGTDPKDYTYRDPYDLADIDAQPIPEYRRPLAAPPVTQKKQVPPQRPPLVVAAATQPPVIHTVEYATSQTVQRTRSQQFESGFDAFSQEPMASTQTLPGPFGGRPGVGKKPAKKRIGGF
ncbi:hypothetical protein J3R83DRAFT_4727 [Lanmaoa asiatica]|nr:hypothetical protein J3R83DRAFT_4727 [Lanmaoa asiatica]